MKFYANPYNASVSGFYFETYEEFELKLSDLKDDFGVPVEEVEIEAIDGTREEMELADVFGIDQANIAEFIAFIETSDEDLWPAIYFILNDNRASSFDEAIRIARDYSIRECELIDAASEIFNEVYDLPDEVKMYIDYEKYADDLRCGGDMVEFEFGGKTFTCMNANQ